MCLFVSLVPVHVSDTRIIVFRINETQQLTFYNNKLTLDTHGRKWSHGESEEARVTMILAVPGKAEEIIVDERLQEIGDKVFKACEEVFAPATGGFSFGGGLPSLSASSSPKLEVKTAGSYEYSIVPDWTRLRDVDTDKLPVPDTLLTSISQEYKDGRPLIVARLRAGHKYKPFAYVHGAPAGEDLCFAPFFHAHKGEAPPEFEEHCDHDIYIAGVQQPRAAIVRKTTNQGQILNGLKAVRSTRGFGFVQPDEPYMLPCEAAALLQQCGIPLGVHPDTGRPASMPGGPMPKAFSFGDLGNSGIPLAKVSIHGRALNGDIYVRGQMWPVPFGASAFQGLKAALTPTSAYIPTPAPTPAMTRVLLPSSTPGAPRLRLAPLTDNGGTTATSSTSTDVRQRSQKHVSVLCDACGTQLVPTAARFRCMECVDIDVCVACFQNGRLRVSGSEFKHPNPRHTSVHSWLYLDEATCGTSRSALDKRAWRHKYDPKCTTCGELIVGYQYVCTLPDCQARLCEACDQRTDKHDPLHTPVLRQAPAVKLSTPV